MPDGGAPGRRRVEATEYRSLVLDQELAGVGTELYGGFARSAKAQQNGDTKKFKVSRPVGRSAFPKSAVDARRAKTWKMVDGKKNVKAR